MDTIIALKHGKKSDFLDMSPLIFLWKSWCNSFLNPLMNRKFVLVLLLLLIVAIVVML